MLARKQAAYPLALQVHAPRRLLPVERDRQRHPVHLRRQVFQLDCIGAGEGGHLADSQLALGLFVARDLGLGRGPQQADQQQQTDDPGGQPKHVGNRAGIIHQRQTAQPGQFGSLPISI